MKYGLFIESLRHHIGPLALCMKITLEVHEVKLFDTLPHVARKWLPLPLSRRFVFESRNLLLIYQQSIISGIMSDEEEQ